MEDRIYSKKELEYAYNVGVNKGMRNAIGITNPDFLPRLSTDIFPTTGYTFEQVIEQLDEIKLTVPEPLPWYEDVTTDQIYWTALVCILIAIIIFS